jgi:hypothetical protein
MGNRQNGKFAIILLAALLCLPRLSQAVDVFPTEAWPTQATVEALDGTTHTSSGLPFILTGTKRTSTPPAQVQIDRMFSRLFDIVATSNELRVVKVTSTTIGVFPGDYVLGSTMKHYAGTTSEAVSTTTDTYYVYLNSSNVLTIVTDAAGWPVDVATFVPLAEVNVSGSVITSIVDRRGWTLNTIGGGGGSVEGISKYGTVEDVFKIGTDDDHASVLLKAGTIADEGRMYYTGHLWQFFYNAGATDQYATLDAQAIALKQTTGTAPMTVVSTTKVNNLNVDSVDGVGFGTMYANGVLYGSSATAVSCTAGATIGDVLVMGTSAPMWYALGTTSGVQAYDADLDAIAALSTSGLVARTGAGTAAARTLTAGAGIEITYGDGVLGDPTIAVGSLSTTNHAVQVGTNAGGIASVTVGTSNTVLAGNTGADPSFRQIVNADVSDAASIAVAKLTGGQAGYVLRSTGASVPQWQVLFSVYPTSDSTMIDAYDAPATYPNTGATSLVTFDLPTCQTTAQFTFVVMDADGIKVKCASGDKIRDASGDSAAAGYVTSTAIGSSITIQGVDATYWFVLSKTGTWTIDTP